MEANVIRHGIEQYEQELKQEQAIEKRLKIQSTYNPNELERRLRTNMSKLWYLPVLAYYFQEPDFDKIRYLNFIDAMASLRHIIITSPVK